MGKVNLFSQCGEYCDCCKDCLNNNDKNTNNLGNITNEEGNQEENQEENFFDLRQPYDLNNFNLGDLENFLISILSERFYECQLTSFNKKKDKVTIGASFNLTFKKELDEEKKNVEDIIFKNIEKLSKENFEKIDNKYTKLLATFFLSDKDYEDYINQQVDEMKNNFSKSENTSTINNFIYGNKKDNNFIKALKDVIAPAVKNGGFNSSPEKYKGEIDTISNTLRQCNPYEKETFRGTGIYKEGSRISCFDTKVKSSIAKFFSKIKKDCLWEEYGLRSYSSDPIVAGFYTLNTLDRFDTCKFYGIFLHCHLNKTGVSLLEAYKEKEKDIRTSLSYMLIPKEKEVLYPENSKFKILGMHIKIKEAYVSKIGEKYYREDVINGDEEEGEFEEIPITDENKIVSEIINGKKKYFIMVNNIKKVVYTKERKILFPLIVLDLVQIE